MAVPRNFVVREVKTEENGVTQIGHGNTINYADPLEKQRNVQKWFASWLFEDPNSAQRSQASILRDKGNPVKGCGEWLTHKLLPNWLAQGSDNLWIHGDVGSGKSVLCSLTISELRRTQPKFGTLLAIPAIFSFDADYTSRPEFLPNTILAWLCSFDPIPPPIKLAQETHLNSSEISDVEDLIETALSGLNAQGVEMDKGKLTLVMILDAIDEVSYDQQRRTLTLINNLISLNPQFSAVRLRTILFTRNDTRVQELCRSEDGWTHQAIPGDALHNDISIAVLGRLKNSRLRTTEKERISLASTITERASGMFRLAGLYVDHLLKPNQRKLSARQLETVITSLPDDLYEFYDRIIFRIEDSEARRQSYKSLRWLLHAARVLSLNELVEACSVPFPGDYEHDAGLILDLDPLDVIEPLSGFIHVNPPLPEDTDELDCNQYRITIAHFSVGEYLVHHVHRSFELKPSFFTQLDASLYLMNSSFCYLIRYLSNVEVPTGREWPLAKYAIDYWPHHVAAYIHPFHRWTECCSLNIKSLALKVRNTFAYPDAHLYQDGATLKDRVLEYMHAVLSDEQSDIFCNAILGSSSSLKSLGGEETLYYPLGLGQARFLMLYPDADDGAPLNCDLFLCSFDNKPNYEFMSYAWNPGSIGEADVLQWTQVPVNRHKVRTTRTLLQVLNDVRSHLTIPQAIWVDQICIDQEDSAERFHQVQQLSSTVEQAKQVKCWLKPQYGAHDTLLTFDVLSNTFWKRTWIIQEIVLAREITLLIGRKCLPWHETLVLRQVAVNQLSQKQSELIPAYLLNAVKNGVQTIGSINRFRTRRSFEGKIAIEDLLFAFRDLHATHPTDKIVALLPIITENVSSFRALIDYEIPVTGVYVRFAVISMSLHNSLDLLAINNVNACHHGMPSWAPCWMDTIYDDPLSPGIFMPDQPPLFQASRKTPRYEFREAISELHIYGILVDEISVTWTRDRYIRRAWRKGHQFPTLSRLALGESRESSPWPNDIIPIASPEQGDPPKVMCEDPAIARALTEERTICPFTKTSKRASNFDFLVLTTETLPPSRAHRLICETQSGRLGNLPARARAGDVIVVLEGAKTPHVLRPSGAIGRATTTYELIGECYLDGCMDGEAEESTEDGLPKQIMKFMIE